MREDDGVHVAVASLQAISASVKDLQAEKRRIQRRLDRCDRSANGGYDTAEDIRREEALAAAEGRTLPPRCYEPTRYETGPGGRRIRKLGKRIPGSRLRNFSKERNRLAARLAEIDRLEAAARETERGRLANWQNAMGADHVCEDVSVKSAVWPEGGLAGRFRFKGIEKYPDKYPHSEVISLFGHLYNVGQPCGFASCVALACSRWHTSCALTSHPATPSPPARDKQHPSHPPGS
jgi:hypothetical protein